MSDIVAELAAWLGVNQTLLAFVLGAGIIISIAITMYLVTESAPLAMLGGLGGFVLVIGVGLFPTWVAFVLIFGGAIIIIFGGGLESKGSGRSGG